MFGAFGGAFILIGLICFGGLMFSHLEHEGRFIHYWVLGLVLCILTSAFLIGMEAEESKDKELTEQKCSER